MNKRPSSLIITILFAAVSFSIMSCSLKVNQMEKVNFPKHEVRADSIEQMIQNSFLYGPKEKFKLVIY